MIIFLISHKNHNVVMMVQMRGHNIGFYAELTKIIHNYHPKLPLIYSSVYSIEDVHLNF